MNIRDEKYYAQHVDYIHFNPVKHDHVMRAMDWPYSSLHRDIQHGLYTRDWGAANDVQKLEME